MRGSLVVCHPEVDRTLIRWGGRGRRNRCVGVRTARWVAPHIGPFRTHEICDMDISIAPRPKARLAHAGDDTIPRRRPAPHIPLLKCQRRTPNAHPTLPIGFICIITIRCALLVNGKHPTPTPPFQSDSYISLLDAPSSFSIAISKRDRLTVF